MKSDFEQRYNQYKDMIWRLALQRCTNRQDAEDVLQDVFLVYLNTDVVFADDEHLKAWLLRVAVNHCRRRLATPWRTRTVLFGDLDAERIPGPGGPTDAGDLTVNRLDHMAEQADLAALLARLKPDDRTLIYLYYFECLPFESIGAILNRSPGSLRTRLYRLRKCLKAYAENGRKE